MADFEQDIKFGDTSNQMPPSFPPVKAHGTHRLQDSQEDAPTPISDPAQVRDTSNSADEINKLAKNAAYPQQSKLKSFLANTFEFVVLIVAALAVVIFLKTFVIQPFEIPSSSMANTLLPDDRILVNKLADTEDELRRGDVVVFVDPGNWLADVEQPERSGVHKILAQAAKTIGLLSEDEGTYLVKRLIGKPGDHIVCCTAQGNLTINGTEVEEPYLIEGATASDTPFDITVPDGHLWMMGDNRPGSKDSRYHQATTGFGFVPLKNVEGRAWLRVYPFDRFAKLPSQAQVFENVPELEAAK